MKIIQYILIFAGIFLFLSLGVMFLLKSSEAKKRNLKQINETKNMIQEVNQELDDLLDVLEEVNEPLEEVVGFVDKINNKVF